MTLVNLSQMLTKHTPRHNHPKHHKQPLQLLKAGPHCHDEYIELLLQELAGCWAVVPPPVNTLTGDL